MVRRSAIVGERLPDPIVDHGLGMSPARLERRTAGCVERERLDVAPTRVLGPVRGRPAGPPARPVSSALSRSRRGVSRRRSGSRVRLLTAAAIPLPGGTVPGSPPARSDRAPHDRAVELPAPPYGRWPRCPGGHRPAAIGAGDSSHRRFATVAGIAIRPVRVDTAPADRASRGRGRDPGTPPRLRRTGARPAPTTAAPGPAVSPPAWPLTPSPSTIPAATRPTMTADWVAAVSAGPPPPPRTVGTVAVPRRVRASGCRVGVGAVRRLPSRVGPRWR